MSKIDGKRFIFVCWDLMANNLFHYSHRFEIDFESVFDRSFEKKNLEKLYLLKHSKAFCYLLSIFFKVKAIANCELPLILPDSISTT